MTKLDQDTVDVMIEVVLCEIDIPPKARYHTLKAFHKLFPEYSPPWVELKWRIEKANEERERHMLKRRDHEKRLMKHAQAVLAKA